LIDKQRRIIVRLYRNLGQDTSLNNHSSCYRKDISVFSENQLLNENNEHDISLCSRCKHIGRAAHNNLTNQKTSCYGKNIPVIREQKENEASNDQDALLCTCCENSDQDTCNSLCNQSNCYRRKHSAVKQQDIESNPSIANTTIYTRHTTFEKVAIPFRGEQSSPFKSTETGELDNSFCNREQEPMHLITEQQETSSITEEQVTSDNYIIEEQDKCFITKGIGNVSFHSRDKDISLFAEEQHTSLKNTKQDTVAQIMDESLCDASYYFKEQDCSLSTLELDIIAHMETDLPFSSTVPVKRFDSTDCEFQLGINPLQLSCSTPGLIGENICSFNFEQGENVTSCQQCSSPDNVPAAKDRNIWTNGDYQCGEKNILITKLGDKRTEKSNVKTVHHCKNITIADHEMQTFGVQKATVEVNQGSKEGPDENRCTEYESKKVAESCNGPALLSNGMKSMHTDEQTEFVANLDACGCRHNQSQTAQFGGSESSEAVAVDYVQKLIHQKDELNEEVADDDDNCSSYITLSDSDTVVSQDYDDEDGDKTLGK
jgi:hypothetical protein